MANYFVRPTNGSDTNDGLDFHGFGLTAGSYDDLGHGDGDYRLSETGAFTGYTWVSGDTIYLSGGAGITAGLYGIASKVSNDVILLAASAGSDSTADVTSASGAFLTIQKGLDTATAGDTLRCCKEGSSPHETSAAQIDVDLNDGTSTAPISIVAANGTTGVIERNNGRYVIQISASVSRVMYFNGKGDYTIWEDIEFDGNNNATSADFITSAGTSTSNVDWFRCGFIETTATARYVRARSNYQFTQCFFEGPGLVMASSYASAWSCTFIDCTKSPALDLAAAGSDGLFNVIIGASGDGIEVNYNQRAIGNVIINCTGDGIYSDQNQGIASSTVIYNNVLVGNGDYGLRVKSTGYQGDAPLPVDYNHYYNNTSGAIYDGSAGISEANANTTIAYGTNNTTGDPGLTNITSGTEDWLPSSDSAAVYGTGLRPPSRDGTIPSTGTTMGPMAPAAGGGGSAGGCSIIGGAIVRAVGGV